MVMLTIPVYTKWTNTLSEKMGQWVRMGHEVFQSGFLQTLCPTLDSSKID